jgi:hypothetical protein
MANSIRIEPLLGDFKIGTAKKIRWELLNRKTDGFGGGGEPLAALREFSTY